MPYFQSKLKTADNVYKELFVRHLNNPILAAEDWPYPINTTFNPAATYFQNKVLLLARVEDRRGFSHFTKAVSEKGVVNWMVDTQPTFESDPKNYPEEAWGIEDPRITRLDELGAWGITYTAYSKAGPMVSLALTKDFQEFKRMGCILPPDDKDAALFPRRFNGKWVLIHRPMLTSAIPGAHIWISDSEDLKTWSNHRILIQARAGAWWDASKVGLSAQPMETSEGWLILYHGVKLTAAGAIYRLGLALLDIDDPFHVLRRSDEWIFGPREYYEKEGDVGGAVFPCGWILDQETGKVRMYYGAADSCIALATANLSELLEYIKSCPEVQQDMSY
jgi:predicted GH43/DUF377 family glycosyl hydrolase